LTRENKKAKTRVKILTRKTQNVIQRVKKLTRENEHLILRVKKFLFQAKAPIEARFQLAQYRIF